MEMCAFSIAVGYHFVQFVLISFLRSSSFGAIIKALPYIFLSPPSFIGSILFVPLALIFTIEMHPPCELHLHTSVGFSLRHWAWYCLQPSFHSIYLCTHPAEYVHFISSSLHKSATFKAHFSLPGSITFYTQTSYNLLPLYTERETLSYQLM